MYELTASEENTSDLIIGTLNIEDIEMVAEVCKLFEKERGGKVRYSYKEDVVQNFKEDIYILNEVCNRMRKRERQLNEWPYSYRMGAVLTSCSNLISNAISQCILMDDTIKLRIEQKTAPEIQQPTNGSMPCQSAQHTA